MQKKLHLFCNSVFFNNLTFKDTSVSRHFSRPFTVYLVYTKMKGSPLIRTNNEYLLNTNLLKQQGENLRLAIHRNYAFVLSLLPFSVHEKS